MITVVSAGALVLGIVVALPPESWARGSGGQDITTVAGGGTATSLPHGNAGTSVALGSPVAATPDANGNLLVPDPTNNVVDAVAATNGTWYGQAMLAGHIYTIIGDGNPGYSGDGLNQPLTQDELTSPNGVAVDAGGDVVITDTGNNAVRFIPTSSGTYFGIAMTAGQIFTIAGGGLPGQIADGGQATSAGMDSPDGVAFDPAGDVVVADTNNDVVRIIPRTAHAAFGRALQTGRIYTLAGDANFGYGGDNGPAGAAQLALQPYAGVAVDADGNIAIADGGNSVIRVVAAASGAYRGKPVTGGDIYTVAGTGNPGFSGDKHAATAAMLDTPQGVAFDPAGDLLISDSNNNVIRLVPAATGVFEGKRVKAGDIYNVVGKPTGGYSGDGGPASAAELSLPAAVAVGSSGHIVIADNGNNVIRETVAPFARVAVVRPAAGPVSGGRRVIIKGANLSGASAVYFGGKPAPSLLVNTAKKVVAISPPGVPGSVVITVVTAGGTSVAGPGDVYTYSTAAVPRRHRAR